MECLPDLLPPLSRTVDLTVELLRRQPVAEALSRDLARLARTYRDCAEEAVFVRIRFGQGHIDGWYRPRACEFEPTGFWPTLELA